MATARQSVVCAAATLFFFGFTSTASAAPGDVITIKDEALSASGGLAADPQRHVYWTAAPSPAGATGVVQAINPDGSTAGEVTYDAAPSAVEALSMFNGQLYVGDIGGSRPAVTVYRLESLSYGQIAPHSQWTLTYPDGPQEAAAMMVSPRGNIWIITKGAPGGLYYVPAPAPLPMELRLERVADAPAWVTDATFTGATSAVLRTYNSVLAFDMTGYTVTAAEPAPAQPQGESITTALDGTGLTLGSRNDPRLLEVAAPTSMQEVAAAPSVPPGTPSPTVEPTETETPDPTTQEPQNPTEQPEPTGGSSSTAGALGIAAVISVGAGVLAFLGSKPKRRTHGKAARARGDH